MRPRANGLVYLGGADGNVYAFGLPGGTAAVKRPAARQLQPNHALRPHDYETGLATPGHN